jgi:hypothetical protein
LECATAIVSTFSADLGGTEIYAPLATIFSQPIISRASKSPLDRHLFLLTDGAVSNTELVVDLIRQHSVNGGTKVHTFGIGSGVSTELVKRAAMAGCGHFYFINDMQEIDRKVIDAVQKQRYEYLIVKELKMVDKNEEELKILGGNQDFKKLDTLPLNSVFSKVCIVDPAKEHLHKASITVFDPNCNKETKMDIHLQYIEGYEAIFKVAAHQLLKNNKQVKKQEISIKYQVLDSTTSMFVAEKLVDTIS